MSISDKARRFDQAASRERLEGPDMIQKNKAVRYPAGDTGYFRHAYCAEDPGDNNQIYCYLDTDWDGEGEEPEKVPVTFAISGSGTRCDQAIPYMKDGTPIWITKFADWGTYTYVGNLQSFDTEQLQIGVGGKLCTKLSECV